MSKELDQEQYSIIIQSDYSIKIDKISKDLSRPELKRTSAGLHFGIYTISEFSCIFQKLYKSILASNDNLNNNSALLSFLDKNTINDTDLTNVDNNIPINQTLLPIIVNNSIGLDYSDLYPPPSSDEEYIKKVPEKPKLSRTTTICLNLKKENDGNLEV